MSVFEFAPMSTTKIIATSKCLRLSYFTISWAQISTYGHRKKMSGQILKFVIILVTLQKKITTNPLLEYR